MRAASRPMWRTSRRQAGDRSIPRESPGWPHRPNGNARPVRARAAGRDQPRRMPAGVFPPARVRHERAVGRGVGRTLANRRHQDRPMSTTYWRRAGVPGGSRALENEAPRAADDSDGRQEDHRRGTGQWLSAPGRVGCGFWRTSSTGGERQGRRAGTARHVGPGVLSDPQQGRPGRVPPGSANVSGWNNRETRETKT